MGIYIEEIENMRKFIELHRKKRRLQEQQIKEGLSQKSVNTSIFTKNKKSYGRNISIKIPKADIIIKYRLNSSKNFFKNFSDMMAYRFGFFDDLENMNPDELNSEERSKYWEDVKKLDDIKSFDESFSRNMEKLKFGLAAIWLAGSISLGTVVGKKIVDSINGETIPEEEQNQIIFQIPESKLKSEIRKVKLDLLYFEDQDYLFERLNPKFIPENATEEEMRAIMQEAWEALEPEIQEYVRSPKSVYEAEKRYRQEIERQRQFIRSEEELNKDETALKGSIDLDSKKGEKKEIADRELGD